jgi:hypothetical protein
VADDVVNLRPRHDWVKVLGFLAGIAGSVWAVASWAARTPTPERFEKLSIDVGEVRLNQAVMGAQFAAFGESTRAALSRIEKRLDEQPAAAAKGRRDR